MIQLWYRLLNHTICADDRALNKKSKCSDAHIQVQNLKKIVLVMSLKYTPVTQSILCLILFMYVRTTQSLKCSGHKSKKTICSLWFWQTCDFATRSRSSNPVRTGRPHARLWCKVWKTLFEQCPRKANNILPNQEPHQLSHKYVHRLKTVAYSWQAWYT